MATRMPVLLLLLLAVTCVSSFPYYEDDDSECPEDSVQSDDKECKCKPLTECYKPTCNGEKPILIGTAEGKPGKCCDEYRCPRKDCIYNNETKANGTTWRSNCDILKCEDGLSLHISTTKCQEIPPACTEVYKPPGECCPVCKTFAKYCMIAGTNRMMSEGSVWNDDPCTKCTCEDGKVSCKSSLCDVKCVNPKYIPTECCPICDGSPDIIYPPSVGLISTCKTSDGGVHRDGETWFDGCRSCYCVNGLEMCNLITCPVLKCENPVFNSSSGCCPLCPDLEISNKTDHHSIGCFSVDGEYRVEGETWELDKCTKCLCHSGQVLCHSRSCPPSPCNNPLQKNEECCAYCNDTTIHSLKNTVSCANHRLHGDTWNEDNCRSCVCNAGIIQCFTQKCPQLSCKKPVHIKNKCCPVCLDKKSPKQCTIQNKTVVHGEKIVYDKCIECICNDGLEVCSKQTCPEKCLNPLILPDTCCPVCQDSNKTTSETTYPLYVAIGVVGLLAVCLGVCLAFKCYRSKCSRSKCSSNLYNDKPKDPPGYQLITKKPGVH